MTSSDVRDGELGEPELAIGAKAEALARGAKPENLAQVGDLLAESTSAPLSRFLAKLLFGSGPGGVAVLLEHLIDPAVILFAVGALRFSDDAAVWEALLAANRVWAAERRAELPLGDRISDRLSLSGRLRIALPRDPSGAYSLYGKPKYGFSMRLPPTWVSLGRRQTHPGLLVQFAGDPRAAKTGDPHVQVEPMVSVTFRPVPVLLDAETVVTKALREGDARVDFDVLEREGAEPELLEDVHFAAVNGHPAVSYRLVAGLRTYEHYSLAEGRCRYQLFTSALVRDWEAKKPMLDEIIQSVTVTTPA